MKNNNRRILLYLCYIAFGVVLVVLSMKGILDNFFSGFGGGFVGVGLIMIIKAIMYNKNAEYREKIDTENNDERNKYINMKAWSWAGYLYVIIMATITVICAILNQMAYMKLASLSLTLVTLLYFISYLIVRKKY